MLNLNHKPPLVIAGMRRVGRRYFYDVAKACIRCSTVKDVEDFHVMPSKGGTRAPYCKACNSEFKREWDRKAKLEREWDAYHVLMNEINAGRTVNFRHIPVTTRRVIMNQLFRAGRTIDEITELVQCTRSTVFRHMHRYERMRERERGHRVSDA